MTLDDIAAMPGFDPKVPNGARSVTEDRVFYGRNPGQGGRDTVSCREHGATLCVAKNDKGAIWRCPACNEGAFVAKRTRVAILEADHRNREGQWP